MEQLSAEGFLSNFEALKDPRINNANKRHELSDLLLLSVLAVIFGAEGWTDIEDFGKAKASFLNTFLTLPNGIPSQDIIGHLFSRLCPDTIQSCFLNWVQSIASFEMTTIPELIKLLNLTGSLVTIDAMGCQKKITKAIRVAEADSVLAVKRES